MLIVEADVFLAQMARDVRQVLPGEVDQLRGPLHDLRRLLPGAHPARVAHARRVPRLPGLGPGLRQLPHIQPLPAIPESDDAVGVGARQAAAEERELVPGHGAARRAPGRPGEVGDDLVPVLDEVASLAGLPLRAALLVPAADAAARGHPLEAGRGGALDLRGAGVLARAPPTLRVEGREAAPAVRRERLEALPGVLGLLVMVQVVAVAVRAALPVVRDWLPGAGLVPELRHRPLDHQLPSRHRHALPDPLEAVRPGDDAVRVAPRHAEEVHGGARDGARLGTPVLAREGRGHRLGVLDDQAFAQSDVVGVVLDIPAAHLCVFGPPGPPGAAAQQLPCRQEGAEPERPGPASVVIRCWHTCQTWGKPN
mmetsp:Transcript_122891/g.358682  ORF Transcript_122891/g.358682 Transcript_122891/m.358682 type:complete len:368 (-) Transcript_122891:46-1149(-)